MMAAVLKILGLGHLDKLKAAFRAKMERLSEKALQGNFRAMERAVRELNAE
jgi:hypothetical protein